MTTASTPSWHLVKEDRFHAMEVLASADQLARDHCIAVVENFGHGWYANALPPCADGTSSMVSGMIRGGAYGDNVEAAKAWCERICGLHPEKPDDLRSEPDFIDQKHPSDPSTRDRLVRSALCADPTRSDRDVARAVGCSPTTVGRIRGVMGLRSSVRSVQRGGQIYSIRAPAAGAAS